MGCVREDERGRCSSPEPKLHLSSAAPSVSPSIPAHLWLVHPPRSWCAPVCFRALELPVQVSSWRTEPCSCIVSVPGFKFAGLLKCLLVTAFHANFPWPSHEAGTLQPGAERLLTLLYGGCLLGRHQPGLRTHCPCPQLPQTVRHSRSWPAPSQRCAAQAQLCWDSGHAAGIH